MQVKLKAAEKKITNAYKKKVNIIAKHLKENCKAIKLYKKTHANPILFLFFLRYDKILLNPRIFVIKRGEVVPLSSDSMTIIKIEKTTVFLPQFIKNPIADRDDFIKLNDLKEKV